MKKYLFTLAILIGIGKTSFSQTSIFPTNGNNVGIGTSAPVDKLDVYGALRIRLNTPNFASATDNSVIDYVNTSLFPATPLMRIAAIGTSGIASSISFLTGTSTGLAEAMRIAGNQNVGIGQTNPAEKLSVSGNIASYATSLSGAGLPVNVSNLAGYRIEGSLANAGHNGITYRTPGGGGAAIGFYRGGAYDTSIDFYTSGASDNTPGTIKHRLRISDNGNVGIGTQTPTEKLSVNGTIRAKEVRVEASSWPDYVFHKTYSLQPLSEVEKFIQTNQHLPGIPSASEVEKNGLNLGEMNARLLKKIEELTLHLINQEKRLDEQNLLIKELQEKTEISKK